ncbi:hypothetical protein [Streptomyces sp. NPDC047990]|uniref:hypothetical protein n=1 Tax=Streptomyces sp. NPDC047990 TaxID=3365496 RepID=UPI00371E0BDB
MSASTVTVDLPPYAKLMRKIGPPLVLAVALVMSIPGEIHLAEVAGWGRFTFFGFGLNMATLMPVCVSVYAACSAVIADVAKRLSLPNRKSALAGAVAALILALCAQDISHLIQLDYMHTGWLLVGAVSAIPPMVAAHMLHMSAAPADTSSVHEVPELDELDYDDEDDEMTEAGNGRRRGGRKGLSLAEVEAAISSLKDAGDDVTPENLAVILKRAPRTARRYLDKVKAQEATSAQPVGVPAAQMLPIAP